MKGNSNILHAKQYTLTLDLTRFLVIVARNDDPFSVANEPLPEWIFDSDYVMWLCEGPEPLHERAMAGAWARMLLSGSSNKFHQAI